MSLQIQYHVGAERRRGKFFFDQVWLEDFEADTVGWVVGSPLEAAEPVSRALRRLASGCGGRQRPLHLGEESAGVSERLEDHCEHHHLLALLLYFAAVLEPLRVSSGGESASDKGKYVEPRVTGCTT
jgi:hypothetical protein